MKMSRKWTDEKIASKKIMLINQLETGKGRFALFILRTFKYIQYECIKNNDDWCIASKNGGRKLVHYVYNGPDDHMAYSVIESVKDHLKQLGYIKYVKSNDIWQLHIIKDIDFCDINLYVQDDPNAESFYQKVYNHLLNSGINVYSFKVKCWKCRKETDVYSYFLGEQLETQMGDEFTPHKYFIENNGLFDYMGIGSFNKIDKYMSACYQSIQQRYSKQMGEYYYMNCCSYCDAHQRINFVVYRPMKFLTGLKKTD